jgi:hypothetical protein
LDAKRTAYLAVSRCQNSLPGAFLLRRLQSHIGEKGDGSCFAGSRRQNSLPGAFCRIHARARYGNKGPSGDLKTAYLVPCRYVKRADSTWTPKGPPTLPFRGAKAAYLVPFCRGSHKDTSGRNGMSRDLRFRGVKTAYLVSFVAHLPAGETAIKGRLET